MSKIKAIILNLESELRGEASKRLAAVKQEIISLENTASIELHALREEISNHKFFLGVAGFLGMLFGFVVGVYI